VKLITDSWMADGFDLLARVKTEMPEHLAALSQEAGAGVTQVELLVDQGRKLLSLLQDAQHNIQLRIDHGNAEQAEAETHNAELDEPDITLAEHRRRTAAASRKGRKRKTKR
jgi:hypothetical protein